MSAPSDTFSYDDLMSRDLFIRYAAIGPRIIIAVSGGGDSMALLDLYRLARTQNANLPEPCVVTVDHGLRSGFAGEAQLVETYCVKHNIAWLLVAWAGEKPKTGIMAAARLARYRLLADAAAAFGAGMVLTGHNHNDQIETTIMRASRGAGQMYGTIPMDGDVLFERRVLISRPLLSKTRAELRAHLMAAKIAFADDPTNNDLRFERIKVRAHSLNADVPPINANPKARRELAADAAAFVLANVTREDGRVVILAGHDHSQDAKVFALRYLAASLGGFIYPASNRIGEELAALLACGQNGTGFSAQRCRFKRVSAGLCVEADSRHTARAWLLPSVPPFETFCAVSMMPLANALAELVGAKPFLSRDKAAI
jgi:tRNA(Ile)-lysidine synthase